MSFILLCRLWVMLFLHYFVSGAWRVIMGTSTTAKLRFVGGQVGLASESPTSSPAVWPKITAEPAAIPGKRYGSSQLGWGPF